MVQSPPGPHLRGHIGMYLSSRSIRVVQYVPSAQCAHLRWI
jgi:hypothetical protein